MSEITVALDAGHGGSDPGATYKGRQEKDDTLRLVQAVGKILEDNGVNVFYTRTGDIYETPFKKATDANNAGADYFVSIHRNSSERPNQYSGVETLVYNDAGIKADMARNVNKELAAAGFANLGVSERPNLVVLKRTQMPAILVEVGFINNDTDNALLDNNFNKIAQAIADGILMTIYQQSPGNSRITSVEDAPDDINVVQKDEGDYDINAMPPASEQEDNGDYPDLDQYYYYNDMNNRNTMTPDSSKILDDIRNLGDRNPENRNPENRNPENRNPENRNLNRDYNSGEPLYRVQVGAYRNKDNAERMLNSLLIEGFPAFIIYEDNLYKVQVGAFRYLANAVKMERRLRRFRYNTFIVYA